MIEALWYKLRCFGLTVEGPVEVFCDNKSVFKNLSIPKSILNKIHNDIYYHRVRGDHTADVLQVGCIPGEIYLAYLFTKTTTNGNKRHNLVESIFSNTVSPIVGIEHRWELPGNYPLLTVLMVIYHCVERIWRILVTPNFFYNIYNH